MSMDTGKKRLKIWTDTAIRLFRYNLKIIFANRFIYFLLTSIGFFLFLVIVNIFSDSEITVGLVFSMLLFPGILLVFYPTAFGIQNDIDTRMLEIIFGIPNYRYKVWLVRMMIIYIVVFLILFILSILSSAALVVFSPFRMVFHLMFPIFFLGCLGFAVSTLVKNGNGTAVVMVVIGLFFLILSDTLEGTKWTIFLNPFNISSDKNEVIWSGIVMWNRIYLTAGIFLTMLLGLYRLQKREKFM